MSLTALDEILSKLPQSQDERLLVGINTADDAGVYLLNDDTALIQTVDFFTPIVDDPFIYGQIAAANSLSDVYAMGGRPLTAMNIVGFPESSLPKEVLADILMGGFEKIEEAGAVLVGGHTIQDDEIKYGLAVTGVVHPDKVLTNAAAQVGDVLILTKPIGTGILSTVLKNGQDIGPVFDIFIDSMRELNKTAAEVMSRFRVNSCTDISGFGLMGHAREMAIGSQVGLQITASAVPSFDGVPAWIKDGYVPGGTSNNRLFLEKDIILPETMSWENQTLLFDAQTSGGLLIAVSDKDAMPLLQALHDDGVSAASIIGTVVATHPGKIAIK